jgi:hypothetical protein
MYIYMAQSNDFKRIAMERMGTGASSRPAGTVDSYTTFPGHCCYWSRKDTSPLSIPTTTLCNKPKRELPSVVSLIQKKV